MAKSVGVAYLLWLVSIFGWLGFHRFYQGKWATGLLWMFTGGVLGIGALFDLFTLRGQIQQYNTTEELGELRQTTLATAKMQQTDFASRAPPRPPPPPPS